MKNIGAIKKTKKTPAKKYNKTRKKIRKKLRKSKWMLLKKSEKLGNHKT